MKKDLQLSASGKEYYSNMLEFAESLEQVEISSNERSPDSDPKSGLSRRSFLSLMGASMAFAGLAGCRRPVEKIIPYVIAPEEIVPGIPEYYATTMPHGLDAIGLIVENHEGRPTKIEGNGLHPSSLGKSNSFVQSSVLNLYDPDRSQSVRKRGKEQTWDEFIAFWNSQYSHFIETGGEGLAILTETSSSPTFVRLKKQFEKTFPKATWATFEPVNDETIFNGLKAATGKSIRPRYHFDKAQIVLALDSDFLLSESNNIRNSFDFATARRVENEHDTMNRLYVVESNLSVTGGIADHRYRLQSSQIPGFTVELARELNAQGIDIPGLNKMKSGGQFDKHWIQSVAKDLIKHSGKSIVLAGRNQSSQVHALIFAINQALKNHGKTINYYSLDPVLSSQLKDLTQLANSMHNGTVNTLVMLGGNPVYNFARDLKFTSALKKVKTSIHLGYFDDDTSAVSGWHIPQAHYLETWGDARNISGYPSIIQPQIEPLFGGKTDTELLSLISTGEEIKPYELVRETWKTILPKLKFEQEWRKTLHDGIYQSGRKSLNVQTSAGFAGYIKSQTFALNKPQGLEIVFHPSHSTFDGRFANNGWLQECPDPVSKLTWDNAAMMSHSTAEKYNLNNDDVAILNLNNIKIELPVLIIPGHADNSVTIELGYGQTAIGRIGNHVGENVYRLQSVNNLGISQGLSITNSGRTHTLVNTQNHHGLDEDSFTSEAIQHRIPVIVRESTVDGYRKNPEFAKEMVEHPPLESLWEEPKYDQGPQWGMSIDLNLCTGCNACTIACQSENNIPVVGKDQVMRGREMHWMRMDRYYMGDMDQPVVSYQPLACQHCEMAPCEQVCPVAATTHSEDGLNGMTYNRCVGTRYCSNNCPYKVRRFNYYNYTKDIPEIVQMLQNPDVTVRFRGVMEKCSFCVQRISRGKILAKNEHRPINDGDVISACQQSCPTDAIVFGDILDPDSRVTKLKKQNRDYALLGELNMKPRNTYLAKLRNPNPEMEKN